MIVPSASTDSIKLLEAGRVDFAILDIHDLAIAREHGGNLVGIMHVGSLTPRDFTEEETRLLELASYPGPPDYPYGERGQAHRDRRISGGRF